MKYEFVPMSREMRIMILNGGSVRPITEIMDEEDGWLRQLNQTEMALRVVEEEKATTGILTLKELEDMYALISALGERRCNLSERLVGRNRLIRRCESDDMVPDMKRIKTVVMVVMDLINENMDDTLIPMLNYFDTKLSEAVTKQRSRFSCLGNGSNN